MYKYIAGADRHIGGYKQSTTPIPVVMSDPPHSITIAEKTDLEAYFPSVLNQGSVGSCVYNSIDEVLQVLQTIHGKKAVSYSRLYGYYWSRIAEGTAANDDAGIEVPTGVSVLETRGICLESSWPYDPDPVTKFAITPPVELDTEAALHKGHLSFGLSNLRAIKACLSQGFPAIIGMQVFSSLVSDECATTGIVHMPDTNEKSQGGHCLSIIGHDDSFVIDGVPGALKLRNHWSYNWGLSGNLWIPYAFVENGLASDCITIRSANV